MLLEHVREVIKPSVDGITNNFDSDTIGKIYSIGVIIERHINDV